MKRMNPGLLQREAAELIGITEYSVWNREHGVVPEPHYNPKLIKFPGHIPFDCPEDTVGRLAWYKKSMEMNLDQPGEIVGRAPEQVPDRLSSNSTRSDRAGRRSICCGKTRYASHLEQTCRYFDLRRWFPDIFVAIFAWCHPDFSEMLCRLLPTTIEAMMEIASTPKITPSENCAGISNGVAARSILTPTNVRTHEIPSFR